MASASNVVSIQMNTTFTFELIADDTTWLAMKILMFGVTPTISLFGIVGNIFSLHILTKHGLQKCSNILLVTLAFSDIMFLIGFNSVPKILYQAAWDHEYRGLSELETRILFALFCVFTVFDYTFGQMGLILPMLITFERLVVIFLPLSFNRIITPPRTWLTVFGLFLYSLSIFIYSSFWSDITIYYDSITNVSIETIGMSEYFYQNVDAATALEEFMVYSCMIIPQWVTAFGCVVIFIKIKLSSIRRKNLTKKFVSTTRTTKMLLSVCCVYIVSSSILSLPNYIPQYASYSLTDDTQGNINKVVYQLINTVVCINSSSNFIVYVVLNKNFRTTFLQLFHWL
ncbi:histamine H2 receptor-like [Physella acuta]|uniref:histamine H2 receptor-like n=1 Tax=Physella acuta TaxID=109671 RepID=UPI0027DB7F92|nr:histamine H2 receptor-like [Physella acuta]